VAAPRPPGAPPPGGVQGRPLPPQAARPPTPAPVPAPAPAAGGDDDFQIERF
ncbi:type IV pili twitching motility protein PilT, partial [Corallococcus sp. CA047B]